MTENGFPASPEGVEDGNYWSNNGLLMEVVIPTDLEKSKTWLVDIKGENGGIGWEISVIRSDFRHGFKSYGWCGPLKIPISSNASILRGTIPPMVWDGLVDLAANLALELNTNPPEIDIKETQSILNA